MNKELAQHADIFSSFPSGIDKNGEISIDEDLIRTHFENVIPYINRCSPGKVVVASFGEDPVGRVLKPIIYHFDSNEAPEVLTDQILKKVKFLSKDAHRNIYMPLAVMSERLNNGQKGTIKNVESVFGVCADFDDENASDYMNRLPMEPDYVLETSSGRYQAVFLFKEPVSPDKAIPVAEMLKNYANCDHGTKDISHVWRVAGTLNWPNKKKINEGRSRQPQLVTYAHRKDMPYGK
jgi:hypothetical protein